MLLLANAPRTTNDIDVFWLEEEAFLCPGNSLVAHATGT